MSAWQREARADHFNSDLVIYGATSAGITAASQAVGMGKTVALIEPSSHLGGLTSGGLGDTDVGKTAVIGGLALDFYRRVANKYRQDRYWPFQEKSTFIYKHHPGGTIAQEVMWTFEPKVAREVFEDMLRERKIIVHYAERLKLGGGVHKAGARIVEITMESGKRFRGKMFIDASYEGDLMAKAGVDYTFGRESRATYDEPLNGISTRFVYPHQRPNAIDAFVVAGDPSSGLLPTVRPRIGEEGAADPHVMAYCYRMCLTNVPENRIPIEKPSTYDEKNYELLLRSIEAGRVSKFFSLAPMPNGKTDSNSTEPFSTNFVGMNADYPDGDYATRQRICDEHRAYQLGLVWTLQHHPRVPSEVQQAMQQWGLPKDEFVGSDHWSPQLYVREARRLIGDFVMRQQHCDHDETVSDAIGMGSYTIDSHYVQRYVDAEGHVQHEGYFDKKVKPYGISYRSIVPKRQQCENLLSPVCLSASHVAYASIRMEPVFMILGQSAAAGACLSIDEHLPVQELDYRKLRERLLSDAQILEWNPSK